MITKEHRQYINKVLYKVEKNPEQREDLVQEVLVRAHRYRDKFNYGGNYKNWLYQVAMNTFYDTLRKAKRPKHQVEFVELDENRDSYTRNLTARLEIEQIKKLVTDEVFWMHVEEGMSDGEIAQATGLSVNTIRSKISRTRKKLNDTLTRSS